MPGPTDPATFGAPASRPTHVPGKLCIKLHRDAVQPHLEGPRRGRGARARALPDAVTAPIDYLRRSAGLRSLEPLFPEKPAARRARAAAAPEDATRLALAASVEGEDAELAGLAIATLPEEEVTGEVMRTVEASPAVQWVETLPVRWPTAAPAGDPMRNMQWGLRAIRWFDAKLPEASEITVGVMDTGIDRKHPDLRDVDITYRHAGRTAADLVGHGTHVAGIVAATANNDVGISGVAACRLTVWKIFDDEPADDGEFYVNAEQYYTALRAAAGAGLASLNLSIGGFERFQTEELLLRRVSRQVTVCAAMGNEYDVGDPIEYPAAFDNVVSVGAMAEDRRRSSFSNTGKHIDLVAPGSHILSTLPTSASPYRPETDYIAWNGTSMATPHVSAAAALIKAANPSFDPPAVTARLRDTAQKLTAMRGRAWTKEYGTGLLDLEGALS